MIVNADRSAATLEYLLLDLVPERIAFILSRFLPQEGLAAGPVEPVGGAFVAPSKERWETRFLRFPRLRQDPRAVSGENGLWQAPEREMIDGATP